MVIYGFPPILEYHGHYEAQERLEVGVQYHYHPQGSIKPRRLGAAISGPHPTTELHGHLVPTLYLGVQYHYHLRGNTKPRWLLTAISGHLMTLEYRGRLARPF